MSFVMQQSTWLKSASPTNTRQQPNSQKLSKFTGNPSNLQNVPNTADFARDHWWENYQLYYIVAEVLEEVIKETPNFDLHWCWVHCELRGRYLLLSADMIWWVRRLSSNAIPLWWVNSSSAL
jgi:hypothetical protein